MGVIASIGGKGIGVTYFFDRVGSTPMTRLEAVVLRRAVEREQLVPAEPKWSMPEGWNSSSGTGADAILYSSSRRLVSVAGVEYPVPAAEQTYVLMVDDLAPSVTVRMIDVPLQPRYEVDRAEAERAKADPTQTLRKAIAARMGESMRAQHVAWAAALHADPVVHQFLNS